MAGERAEMSGQVVEDEQAAENIGWAGARFNRIKNPDENPGQNPGENPGKNPGENPGDSTMKKGPFPYCHSIPDSIQKRLCQKILLQ